TERHCAPDRWARTPDTPTPGLQSDTTPHPDSLPRAVDKATRRNPSPCYGRGEAVIRIAPEVIEQVLTIEIRLRHPPVALVQKSGVAVHVSETRDNGLAGEIDARRALGRLDLALSADGGESIVLDDERRVLDRRASIARDQPCAFEHGRPIALRQAHRHNDH